MQTSHGIWLKTDSGKYLLMARCPSGLHIPRLYPLLYTTSRSNSPRRVHKIELVRDLVWPRIFYVDHRNLKQQLISGRAEVEAYFDEDLSQHMKSAYNYHRREPDQDIDFLQPFLTPVADRQAGIGLL